MKNANIVRIPAKLGKLGVTAICYERPAEDWHERAERLINRRWRMVQAAEAHQREERGVERGWL